MARTWSDVAFARAEQASLELPTPVALESCAYCGKDLAGNVDDLPIYQEAVGMLIPVTGNQPLKLRPAAFCDEDHAREYIASENAHQLAQLLGMQSVAIEAGEDWTDFGFDWPTWATKHEA